MISRLLLLLTPVSLLAFAGWLHLVMEIQPSELHIWQIGLLGAAAASAFLPLIPGSVSLSFLFGNGILATWNTGIEYDKWPGPDFCTGAGSLTLNKITEWIETGSLANCDYISWQWMELSMTGWNAIISILAVSVIAVLRQTRIL